MSGVGKTSAVIIGASGGIGFPIYRVQLVDCLRDTFEKTLLWLGNDEFIDAARAHIESTPPHGWTLGVYGDGFAHTLAELYPNDPDVAELAWLDCALSRAFEGPDAAPVSPERLVAVDWDNAGLLFTPTMQIAVARTNAGAIWSALSAQDDPPMAAILPEPGAMLVWRQDFTPVSARSRPSRLSRWSTSSPARRLVPFASL